MFEGFKSMTAEDNKVLYEAEKECISDRERKRRLDKEKEFEDATSSPTFDAFNRVMNVVSALCALGFCVVALWSSSKLLLLLMFLLLVASFIFARLAKHYFFSGDRKKFETFNKLSNATGVVTSVFEVADMKHYRSKGAIDKANSLESTIRKAVSSISEDQYNGGVYTDQKYDDIRQRANGTGKYIYLSGSEATIKKLIRRVNDKRASVQLTDTASVRVGIISMYIQDYLQGIYPEVDVELFYSCLGALYYFLTPLSDIPDYVPLVGYQDDVFVVFCVYAGNKTLLDTYKAWKIKVAKNDMKSKALKDAETLWKKLVQQGMGVRNSKNVYELCDKCRNKLSSEVVLDESVKDKLSCVADVVSDYLKGNYCTIPSDSINGMIGTLGYWVLKEDMIPDDEPVLGYADDEVMLEVCYSVCEECITEYKKWKALATLYKTNDPLEDYLSTVIGDDKRAREEEVRRLAKLCTDRSLVDVRERARMTVQYLV